MTRQNPNRRRSEYEDSKERKKRQLERQREVDKRRRKNGAVKRDTIQLTESQRERIQYRESLRRKETQRNRMEQQRKAAQQRRRPRTELDDEQMTSKPKKSAALDTRGRTTPKTKNQRKVDARTRKAQEKEQKKIRNSRRKKSKVGIVILGIQIIASLLFVFSLILLDILPWTYLAVIGAVLLILILIVWFTQRNPKGKGIPGKIFSILISAILLVASFYIIKTNGLLNNVFGSKNTTNEMVVAVLVDDPAESIDDAANYNFGVQYANGGDNVEAAVGQIETELDSTIEMTEYNSVQEQAQALINGDVEAIIYSAGYTSLMEEAIDEYSDKVKIIYTHQLQVDLGDTSGSVSITEPFNVYISGIDVYGDVSQNSRSDVNIIATVNPKTHEVLLTTTPRDYYVVIPEISDGQCDKLTHAGVYGIKASMATLENLYDTKMDFYARLNFTSLIKIVDAIGGVNVYSEYEFTTSKAAGCVKDIKKGYNELNGKEALAFARERKNVPGGDNQRGKDQQAVITAMMKKMLSPAMLIQASGLLDSLNGNIETSMSLDQMHGLVKSQLRSNAKWTIKSVEPEGTYDSRYCFSAQSQLLSVTLPDEVSVANIAEEIKKVQNGETLEDTEELN